MTTSILHVWVVDETEIDKALAGTEIKDISLPAKRLHLLTSYAHNGLLSPTEAKIVLSDDFKRVVLKEIVTENHEMTSFINAKQERDAILAKKATPEEKLPPHYRKFVKQLIILIHYVGVIANHDPRLNDIYLAIHALETKIEDWLPEVRNPYIRDDYAEPGLFLPELPMLSNVLSIFDSLADGVFRLNEGLEEYSLGIKITPLRALLDYDKEMHAIADRIPFTIKYLDPEIILTTLYDAVIAHPIVDKQLNCLYLYSAYEMAKLISSPQLPRFEALLIQHGCGDLIKPIEITFAKELGGGAGINLAELINIYAGQRETAIERLKLM